MHFERSGTWIEMDPVRALDAVNAKRLIEILYSPAPFLRCGANL